MRSWAVFLLCVSLLGAACGRASEDRRYTLQGQVIAVATNHLEATIKHEEIKGLMPAMTMAYKVKDARLLDGVVPGDLVTAMLNVAANDAFLTEVKRVGQAPLEAPPPAVTAATSGFELLKPGEAVPNARFTDQDGQPRDFASFKGSTLVITFIYTTCPMPTFCPLMDRHFATLQQRLGEDPAFGRVHLISVSFDPLTDTPPVLKAHASTLGADPARWTFLTGDRDEVDRFGARFGLSVARAPNDPRDITHTLRTAIVDAGGALVKIYTGNEWTPVQVLADLRPVVQTP